MLRINIILSDISYDFYDSEYNMKKEIYYVDINKNITLFS